MTIPDKNVPHDADAEACVIGSLLIDDSVMVTVGLALETGDFFGDRNGWAYSACKALYERGDAINLVTVAHELERQGHLDEAGGPAYLAECVAQVPTSLHAEHYAGIVHRAAVMRKLIQAGTKIVQLGYENKPETDKALAQAEEMLYALHERQSVRGFVHLREVLESEMVELTANKGEHQGEKIPTGFSDLDNLLGGLYSSDLIILAARPSVGKTALVLNVAEYVALKLGLRVAIFSLEMSREQLAQRLLASRAGVDLKRLRLDQLGDSENRRVLDAVGVLSECAIYIDDAAVQRVSDIRGRAKRMSQQHGVDLIVVDYLQLIQGSGQRGQNREQEMSEISRQLKQLARELKVPVLAAAQLNRASEQRPDHRPMLSDLRESGSIEQDADVVMFIFREDKYTTEDDWRRYHPTERYPKGVAEIIVAKHRNGPTGKTKLLFQEQSTRFVSISQREEEHYWQG